MQASQFGCCEDGTTAAQGKSFSKDIFAPKVKILLFPDIKAYKEYCSVLMGKL